MGSTRGSFWKIETGRGDVEVEVEVEVVVELELEVLCLWLEEVLYLGLEVLYLGLEEVLYLSSEVLRLLLELSHLVLAPALEVSCYPRVSSQPYAQVKGTTSAQTRGKSVE